MRESNTKAKDDIPFYTFDSPYGNDLNINHPEVRALAERYCKWKGTTVDYLIHHMAVRKDFERYVLESRVKEWKG